MEGQRLQSFGGNWTADKLDRLRKYLPAYTTALKNQRFHLQYIDAFAGTGYCGKGDLTDQENMLIPDLAGEETQQFLKGSARIALDTEPPFDSFVFIDRDPANCAELNNLKNEFPHLQGKISIVNEDANICLKKLLKGNWNSRRAVLFLDPYGMQVQWETVQAIAGTKAIDMWYLFPLAAVNRLLKKDADISQPWRKRLDSIFGTNDWEEVFYEQKTEQTLFGDGETITKVASFDAIKNFLLARLKSEFAGVAPNPLVLRNDQNSPLFLLCFAAANPAGASLAIKIAKSILGR